MRSRPAMTCLPSHFELHENQDNAFFLPVFIHQDSSPAVCLQVQGYAFCEYQYPELTDVVIESLNLTSVGTKTLTVKRAVVAGQPQGSQALPYLPPARIASAVTGAFSSQYRRLQQEASQALLAPSIGPLSLA